MTELLTAAQMRAIEQAAIDSGEVTGLELMERAGRGVMEAIFAEWPELAAPKPSAPASGGAGGSTPSPPRGSPPEYLAQNDQQGHRAVVLCGPGNNGGDGFVVARLLKEAGWDVEVFLYGDAEKLPPDAKVNYERWAELGHVQILNNFNLNQVLWQSDIIIDAIFGTGLSRLVVGELAEALFGMHADGDLCIEQPDVPRIVSVDIPTGICSDSGRLLGAVAPSHLVVTFHRAKIGLYLDEATALRSKIHVCDIGLRSLVPSNSYLTEAPTRRHSNSAYSQGNYLGKDQTSSDPYPKSLHKYSHGHALILSGGVGKGGAARLAARGAIRIGAGAVTVGAPPSALIENAAQLNAIMLTGVKDENALADILQDTRMNALCLGPGLGTGAREAKLLDAALEKTRPGLDPGTQPKARRRGPGSGPGWGLVLDADALTLLAQDETLFAKLHKNCILTPHAGEFARLFPDIAEKLNAPATKGPAYSKVDATREAAKRAGCVVLFKGPDTVIADPSGRCSINASVYDRSAPWLATAGSGDVLAGFMTGLLARGFQPMQAAETGAWLHTECALSFGPGLIAEDLPEELPKVYRALGL